MASSKPLLFTTHDGVADVLNPCAHAMNGYMCQGYSKLEGVGFSFDMQLNSHQFLKGAAVAKAHPNIPVIINHLGTPTLKDLTGGWCKISRSPLNSCLVDRVCPTFCLSSACWFIHHNRGRRSSFLGRNDGFGW